MRFLKQTIVWLILLGACWAQQTGGGQGSGGTGGSSFPVTAPQLVNIGGAITPAGTGQLSATGAWFPIAQGQVVPFIPTATESNTGGSLVQGTYFVRITYAGLSTIVPSAELRVVLGTANCASNSTCQFTLNMPTTCQSGNLPTGATGCTVWTGNALNAEKQQTASNACVNITTATCVVSVLATGASLTYPSSSGIVPGTITANPQPDGIIPSCYMQLGDGSYTPVCGVDYSALNVLTGQEPTAWVGPAIGSVPGTFTWTHRWFVNDEGSPPPITNAMVSFHHEMCQTTGCLSVAQTAGVDDRALVMQMIDANTSTPYAEQTLTQYNEQIITNNSHTCGPINGGLPAGESCVAAGRFVTADNRTAPTSSSNFGAPVVGLAGVASSITSPNAFSSCGEFAPCIVGVQAGAFQNGASQNGNNAQWTGLWAGVNATASNTLSVGAGITIAVPSTRFATRNYGLQINDFGSNAADWNIYSRSVTPASTGRNYLGGPTFLSSILATAGQINQTGSEVATGGFSTTQNSAAPNANGNNIFTGGTAGSSTDSYKVFGVDANGNEGGSFTTSIATANANLTSSNNVNIQISAPPANGYSTYNFYRTAAASQCNGVACTNGKIGNVVASPINQTGNSTANIVFTDTGQVGDGNSAAAEANSTGGAVFVGLERDGGVCRILADISLTVNTANPFCTFSNLPPIAQGWAVQCEIIWTITAGTGTNTFALGVNASQTPAATTNIAATIETTTGLVGTQAAVPLSASGAVPVLTSATYTPSATLEQAELFGTLSANAAAGSFSITATANGTTATGAVKAGTVCRFF